MKQTPTRLAAIGLILLTLFSPGKGQTSAEAHLSPGEGLVVERIPPIPTSLVREIERYANTQWATFAARHPSKREMLVVPVSSGATTRPQLHLVTAPGEKPVQVTTYPTGMSTARWEEAGHLKFARLVPGEKKTRYFRYLLADGRVELMGERAASVTNTKYSRGGDGVAFSVVNSNGADMDVYVGNPLVPNSTRLLAKLPGGFNVVHDWSPDNKQQHGPPFPTLQTAHRLARGRVSPDRERGGDGEKVLQAFGQPSAERVFAPPVVVIRVFGHAPEVALRFADGGVSRGGGVTLQPGEQREEDVLTDVFRVLSRPGTRYRFRPQLAVDDLPDHGQ